jgi:hypothetical protein
MMSGLGISTPTMRDANTFNHPGSWDGSGPGSTQWSAETWAVAATRSPELDGQTVGTGGRPTVRHVLEADAGAGDGVKTATGRAASGGSDGQGREPGAGSSSARVSFLTAEMAMAGGWSNGEGGAEGSGGGMDDRC